MMGPRYTLIISLAAALLLTSVVGASAQSADAPVWAAKYSLDDIPRKDRKRFWDTIEDIALLDVVIELCEKRRRPYDALLRKEVKSCVDSASMRRVQSYFNKRRAHFSRTATPYACKNPKVMQSMARFRAAVDEGIRKIGSACSLCFFC